MSQSNDWQPISGGRIMRVDPAGFTVIVPETDSGLVPFDCPNCGLMMRQSNDAIVFRRKGCCSRCSTMWAEGHNEERWDAGWRPSREEVMRVVDIWRGGR